MGAEALYLARPEGGYTRAILGLVAEWMHFTLFGITHYKTESVNFLGLMNSALSGVLVKELLGFSL